jgi:hypothetical protein
METSFSNPMKHQQCGKSSAQEEVLRQEEEEGEEDPRKFRIMIQEIHTSTADIMEEAITPKRA